MIAPHNPRDTAREWPDAPLPPAPRPAHDATPAWLRTPGVSPDWYTPTELKLPGVPPADENLPSFARRVGRALRSAASSRLAWFCGGAIVSAILGAGLVFHFYTTRVLQPAIKANANLDLGSDVAVPRSKKIDSSEINSEFERVLRDRWAGKPFEIKAVRAKTGPDIQHRVIEVVVNSDSDAEVRHVAQLLYDEARADVLRFEKAKYKRVHVRCYARNADWDARMCYHAVSGLAAPNVVEWAAAEKEFLRYDPFFAIEKDTLQ